jgi:hypothetical protein
VTDYRIDYIRKPNPYGRIQAVGGMYPYLWELSEDDAIQATRRGDTFHVYRGGYRVAVMVEWFHSPPYLKTYPDGVKIDNLLSLPNLAA